jgi:hypothetical protein
MADLTISAQVIGVKNLQAILKESDRKMLRSTQAMMRKAASPMTAQAKSMTPKESPLSGFSHAGRTGWRQSEVLGGIKATIGGRAVSRTVWPLLSLTQSSPMGMIYDWAGRAGGSKKKPRSAPYAARTRGHANTSQGAAMIKNLPRFGSVKGSQYSRVLFPAFVATRDDVVRAVQDGVDEVARQLNIEIERI